MPFVTAKHTKSGLFLPADTCEETLPSLGPWVPVVVCHMADFLCYSQRRRLATDDSQSSRSEQSDKKVPDGRLQNQQCLSGLRLNAQKIPLSDAIKTSKHGIFLQQTPTSIHPLQALFLRRPNASGEIRNTHENLYPTGVWCTGAAPSKASGCT